MPTVPAESMTVAVVVSLLSLSTVSVPDGDTDHVDVLMVSDVANQLSASQSTV
jgi:hypothetical protein